MKNILSSRLFLAFAIFFAAVLILIAALPTILSTNWGRKQTTSIANLFIPGHLEIDGLSLQWTGGQTIQGLHLNDPQNNSVLDLEKFTTEATLWQLITQQIRVGQTQLQNLHAHLITDEKGISNLQYAIGLLPKTTPVQKFPPTQIDLSETNIQLNLSPKINEPLTLHIGGLTRQSNIDGSFEIKALLPQLQATHWDEIQKETQQLISLEGSKSTELFAQVIHFPVDLFDNFAAIKNPELNGLFRSLLGDQINLALNKEADTDGLAFHLNVTAPLFQSDIKGKIANGRLSLRNPASLHLKLNPAFIQQFIPNSIQLLSNTNVGININEFSIPLAFFSENEAPNSACDIIFKARSTIDPLTVNVASLGRLNLLENSINLQTEACSKTITSLFKARAQLENEPFDLQIDTTLQKPLLAKDIVKQLNQNLNSVIKISHFPLKAFSESTDPNLRMIESSLGSYADVSTRFNLDASQKQELLIALKTPLLDVNETSFTLENGVIKAQQPIIFNYKLEPAFINPLLIPAKMKITAPTLFNVRVDELIFPIESQNAIIKLNAKSTDLQLTDLAAASPMHIKDIDLNLNLHVDKNENSLEFPSIIADLSSDVAKISLKGKYSNEAGILQLTSPLIVSLRPSSDILNTYMPQTQLWELNNSPLFSLEVLPGKFQVKEWALSKLILKGILTADRFDFKYQDRSFVLEDLKLDLDLDAPGELARLDLTGFTFEKNEKQRSKLEARALVFDWAKANTINLEAFKIDVRAFIKNIPTSFINSFLVSEDLTPIFGSSFDIELNHIGDKSDEVVNYWDLAIDSSLFHIRNRFDITHKIDVHEAAKGIVIRWTITPDGYKFLQKKMAKDSLPAFDLAEPVQVSGLFTQVHMPFIPKDIDQTKEAKIEGKFSTGPIKWKGTNWHPVILEANIRTNDKLQDGIKFTATTTSSSGVNLLTLDTLINQLFNTEGKFDLKNNRITSSLHAKFFPLGMIPALFLVDFPHEKLGILIGENIDADAQIELSHFENGTMRGQIKGKQAMASFDGVLKKGVFTLTKPLEADLKWSPEVSQKLLKDSVPILSGITRLENPITLNIDPQGFSLPLIPFDLNKATLSKGSINLGKVWFKNQGELKTILNLIKPINSSEFSIWFTPLYFQLSNGKLRLKRGDMFIADEYAIATWGDVDLQTRDLNMVIGVPSETLKIAFNVNGLPEDFMFQIPVQGKEGNIQIDKKNLMARISALVAQSHSDKNVQLIGNLLGLAVTGGEGKSPEPTTQPFPWEKNKPKPIQEKQKTTNQPISDIEEPAKKKPKKKKVKDELLQQGVNILQDILK